MGRGCRTRLRLRHSSPFPAHFLIALGPHSAKRSHPIPDGFGYSLSSVVLFSGVVILDILFGYAEGL